ncbi:hypothetical protein CHU98_g10837 [Xylaria longipes]|nr:hypothetical protein CHU98_g10837 [Xylaria longipes]
MWELDSITLLLCVPPAGTPRAAISGAGAFRRPARRVVHRYSCMNPPPETETWSTLSCISYAQSTIYVTVPDDSYQVWNRVVQLQPIINAGAVNVRWQPTDFATTTSSTSALSPSSASSFTTSSPTKMPVTSESSTPLRQGLSTGAKIAIGAGIGGGALIILGASTLYFLLVRRNKKHRVGETSSDAPNGNNNTDPKLMKSEVPVEAWALHQTELQTADNTHEMSTASNIHEINTPTPAVNSRRIDTGASSGLQAFSTADGLVEATCGPNGSAETRIYLQTAAASSNERTQTQAVRLIIADTAPPPYESTDSFVTREMIASRMPTVAITPAYAPPLVDVHGGYGTTYGTTVRYTTSITPKWDLSSPMSSDALFSDIGFSA